MQRPVGGFALTIGESVPIAGIWFLITAISRQPSPWRKLYVLQAKLHDDQGHAVDAEQARKMVQYIDDAIQIMEIQIRTRQDGGYLPFAAQPRAARSIPSPLKR